VRTTYTRCSPLDSGPDAPPIVMPAILRRSCVASHDCMRDVPVLLSLCRNILKSYGGFVSVSQQISGPIAERLKPSPTTVYVYYITTNVRRTVLHASQSTAGAIIGPRTLQILPSTVALVATTCRLLTRHAVIVLMSFLCPSPLPSHCCAAPIEHRGNLR
jgi:hypothetical protein